MSLIIQRAGKAQLAIGNYAFLHRKFTKKDILTFATVIGDTDLIHFDSSAAEKLGFNANFVYGAMSASLFSKVFRMNFPGAVYLSQTLNFQSPVYVDEDLEVKIVIESLDISKSNKIKCSMATTVEKLSHKIIAVRGNAILLLNSDYAEISENSTQN